jgi:hypothetical protein
MTYMARQDFLNSQGGEEMKTILNYFILLLMFLPACSSCARLDLISPNLLDAGKLQNTLQNVGYDMSWGTYNLVIARDGSSWQITPNRSADITWGYHLNAVKLLEVSPGHDCIKITGISVLPTGVLSVDISITHPYDNPAYTGFDVRGIIMFPSSQWIPDNEMREEAGLQPLNPGNYYYRFAAPEKGDAFLVNPDGYTTIFAPDDTYDHNGYELEQGFPIFEYYPGKMASGDNLGTLNSFKRYYSTEVRHMFEAGKTITRTFLIQPPASGPIKASYAVHAHWANPLVIPVTNPETDFGPEANSPLPYEFWVEQVGPIDLDAPNEVNDQNIIWHIKSWNFGIEHWKGHGRDLLGAFVSNTELIDTPVICPECYYLKYTIPCDDEDPWSNYEWLPASWPIVLQIRVDNDDDLPYLGSDYYILWLDMEPLDGEW